MPPLNNAPVVEAKRDFPDLIGCLIFAQPTDRSRAVLPYIVLGQEYKQVSLLPVLDSGILSAQTESVHFYNADRGWTLIGYQRGNEVMHNTLASLTSVLENTELTLTAEARTEATRTREYLLEALAFTMRRQRREDREAQDAKIAADRAKEDEEFEHFVEVAAGDPSPQTDTFTEQPYGTGVDITVSIKAPNAELLESTKERLRKALRGANFNF